jgi:peptidoglycan/LPS O-acetylase OafA/YrhL
MVFPLNGPQYTLFLEFVANLAWWALRNWRLRSLAFALAPISLICLYVFGLGGDTVQNFWLGFPRVAFAFMTGLGLYFFGSKYSPNRVVNVAVLCAAALVSIAAFYWPTGLPNWAQVSWVALVAPLLVLSGARLPLGGLLLRSSLFLGEMSYPIYALHYPIFCWVNGVYRGKFGAQNLGIEAPLVFAAVIAGSYLAKRFFDEPLRRWLSRTTAKKSRTQDVAPPRSSGQQGHREQAILD